MDRFIRTSIASTVITIMFIIVMVVVHENTHKVQSEEFGCIVEGFGLDWKAAYTIIDWDSCYNPDMARLANTFTEAVGYHLIPIAAVIIFILCNMWLYQLMGREQYD